jgi:hypothetical protein
MPSGTRTKLSKSNPNTTSKVYDILTAYCAAIMRNLTLLTAPKATLLRTMSAITEEISVLVIVRFHKKLEMTKPVLPHQVA